MGESSPLGSMRILSLPVTEHHTLSAALLSAAAGWEAYPIYPVDDQGVSTCSMWKRCEDSGKHPTTPHGSNDVSSDPERITGMFSRWPGENVGLSGCKYCR